MPSKEKQRAWLLQELPLILCEVVARVKWIIIHQGLGPTLACREQSTSVIIIPSSNDQPESRMGIRVELWGPASSKETHSRGPAAADVH